MQLLKICIPAFRPRIGVSLFIGDWLSKKTLCTGAFCGSWAYQIIGVLYIHHWSSVFSIQSLSSLTTTAPVFFQRLAMVDFPVPDTAEKRCPFLLDWTPDA